MTDLEPIRVAIVEDHAVVREGLKHALSEAPTLHVVGEAAGVSSALSMVRRTRPDVLLLDLSLSDGTGHDVLRGLSEPRPTVLVLTMHDDAESVARCLDAGVAGYLLKGRSTTEVLKAVHRVAAGEQVVDPNVRGLAADPGAVEPLTARERAVLELVAEGLTSGEVAAQLGLSAKTVRNYRERILAKLGVRTTAAMVRAAMRRGWIH